MKVKVEKDDCTGCGLCVDACPEVFEMQEDVAIVKAEVVPDAVVDSCKQAAEECPSEAIIIEE